MMDHYCKKLGQKKTLFQICSSKSELSSLLILTSYHRAPVSGPVPVNLRKWKSCWARKIPERHAYELLPNQSLEPELNVKRPCLSKGIHVFQSPFQGAVSKAHWPCFTVQFQPPKKGSSQLFFNGQKMVHSMATWNICHPMGLSHPNRLRRNHSFIEVHRFGCVHFQRSFLDI